MKKTLMCPSKTFDNSAKQDRSKMSFIGTCIFHQAMYTLVLKVNMVDFCSFLEKATK